MSAAAAPPVFTPVNAMPGMAVLLPPGLSIDNTIGAVVISIWCSVFAFAIVCAAAYVYYVSFPVDRLHFKILVGFVLALSTLDTVSSMQWSYKWIVHLWGSIPGTTTVPHAFYINIVCCATSTLVVQFFYAWRIYLIGNRNPIIPILICACGIAQMCFVIWVEATWGSNIQMANLGIVLPIGYGWAISGIIGDCIISATLFYYLRVQTVGGMASTQTRMTFNSIISRAVQANIFSLVSQIMTFVLFKVNTGFFFFLNDVVLCKIYCFSLLTSLNARRSATGLFTKTGGMTSYTNGNSQTAIPTIGGTGRVRALNSKGSQQGGVTIAVTETITLDNAHDWDHDRKMQIDAEQPASFLPKA